MPRSTAVHIHEDVVHHGPTAGRTKVSIHDETGDPGKAAKVQIHDAENAIELAPGHFLPAAPQGNKVVIQSTAVPQGTTTKAIRGDVEIAETKAGAPGTMIRVHKKSLLEASAVAQAPAKADSQGRLTGAPGTLIRMHPHTPTEAAPPPSEVVVAPKPKKKGGRPKKVQAEAK